MVVPEASINNIMGGLENTAGVRLHNHRRKLKQRFDIVRKLGQGTYGKVQLGINKETGQEVAIKTIKKCKIETEADLIRIRREIQIMSSVQHPNIIHIYEVFENREKMVLVMEYAAGGELYDYLSEKKVLTEDEARRLFRQIATAIYYCHKHKICHRDLKLENVLLDEHGSAKIADFGLSNVFDDCRLLGTFCGSPLYASPEIVKGTPYHGPEVDCWSLGVLLYTLVYGAMPFDGSNFKRLVRQISQGDYFEPKKPSPASPLIREMLNVNPSRRADITAICSHCWVDEGQAESCFDIAEELANQTPVRLDLLLSLAPPAVSNDKLLIPDQGSSIEGGTPGSDRPLRSQSLGSLATTGQLDFIPELPTPAQRDQEVNKASDESTERRRKERSRSRRRDRSSSRSRKHDKQRDDSTSDASISEAKPHRKSSKSSRKKLEDSESKKEVSDNKVTKMEVDENKENERIVNQEAGGMVKEEKMDIELRDEQAKDNKEELKKEKVDKESAVISKKKKSVDDSIKSQLNVDKVESVKEKVVDNKIEEIPKEKIKEEIAHGGKVEEKLDKSVEQNVEDVTIKDNKDIKSKDKSKEEIKPKDEAKKQKEKEDKVIDDEKPSKPIERRKSKIFETAEKFINIQQQDQVKPPPKKVFLPGVKVSDAKKAYERKSSLASSSSFIRPSISRRNSSVEPSSPTSEYDKKFSLASTVALNKLVEDVEKLSKQEDEQKQNEKIAVSSENKEDVEKKGGVNVKQSVEEIKTESIPEAKKVANEVKDHDKAKKVESTSQDIGNTTTDEALKKAATLPRRKTSRAEIKLATPKPVKPEFRSEVEHMVAAPSTPTYPQRAEVVFPVAAVTEPRSTPPPSTPKHTSSQPQLAHKPPPVAKQDSVPREHIIPIQVEHEVQPPKPQPVQRSISRNDSQSLSRQSTVDSDSGSVTSQGEPIRKSPREVIIPIAVEGGGYVTPNVDALTRMGSLNESEDELSSRGFGLHSARRPKKQLETADSISSDEDDDNFEILTAENLFSTLLSRVRNLTHRLNNEENRSSAFPSLFNHHHSLFENSPSRRLSETRSFNRNNLPWRRSMSRDTSSSSTLPRDFSGRSPIRRVLSQRSSDSSTKIPQRSTSFRNSNEKPPPYRSKYLRSLSENIAKDDSRVSQQKSELANISESSHADKDDANNLRESIPKDDNMKNTLSVSEDRSNVSSNSDLSESYKTAKNSRSESVDVSNSKCSEDQPKRSEPKSNNSYSDLSEISQSSDSKSFSKSAESKRFDKTTRNSSSFVSNPISSLSESRITSLNATLPKFRRSSLLEGVSGRNRNNTSELDRIRMDIRAQSSSPLSTKQRRSSYMDDLGQSSNLRYSTLNPSRYSNSSSLRRLSRDSSSYFGSSLSDRISSEDIEKFRSEFRRGFRASTDRNLDSTDETANQERLIEDNSVVNQNSSANSETNIVQDNDEPTKEDTVTNRNIPSETTSNENKNSICETPKENVTEIQNKNVGENDPQSIPKYVKPNCPLQYESSVPVFPTAISKRYNRPKSLYASLNNGDISTSFISSSCDKNSSVDNQNKGLSFSSKIPNYRRTLSSTSGEKQNVTRELKHSHTSVTPDRSVLGKFFEKSNNSSNNNNNLDENLGYEQVSNGNNESLKYDNDQEKMASSKNRRVSRFLRPDFYDTPLEESTYSKKKNKSSSSSSTTSKMEVKRLSRVDSTIKALHENSVGPKECDIIDRESTLIKRAVSLDDVSSVPKKQRAKRSSSVNYEKNAEAVKTIQKYIRKRKMAIKKDNKTELVSSSNFNNINNLCDKSENSGTKNEETLTKRSSLKSYNTRLTTDSLNGPSRRSSTSGFYDNGPNSNVGSTTNASYNSDSYNFNNFKTDSSKENYVMKKINSDSNRQTRSMRIAALEKLDFARPYSSASTESTPNYNELYDSTFDDNSSSILLSPNDDNSDSYSANSDYLDARDFIACSPTSSNAEESVSERIRRKSFYSRFNQKKKKTPPQTQSNINISGMMARSRLPTYRRSFTSADYTDPSFATNSNNNNNNDNDNELHN